MDKVNKTVQAILQKQKSMEKAWKEAQITGDVNYVHGSKDIIVLRTQFSPNDYRFQLKCTLQNASSLLFL